jgi:dihydroorotase
MKLEIKNGRVIDPASKRDEIASLFIAAGRIVGIGAPPADWHATKTMDASGLVVCPGLVDLSVRVGNPGAKGGVHLESELRAAVSGGVTTVVTPPDTQPVLDEPGLVEMLKARAQSLGLAHVLPLGALTAHLQGETLAEMAALHAAGCVGFAQSERSIANTLVLLRAMQYAATCDYTVWMRPRDPWLATTGVMHEGEVSTRLGLPGQPTVAESLAASALVRLAQQAGCKLHLCRVSAAESVAVVRAAKQTGAKVSCDVSAAHLHLSDIDVGYFDTNFHVHPPYRTIADRDALRAGVRDGTIDAIVSDHTPVLMEAKQLPFAESTPGTSAVETLLSLALKWAASNDVPLSDALARITQRPARIAGAPSGVLAVGATADVCIFDPTAHRVLSTASFLSAGKNSPFLGYELPGLVRWTLVGGRMVYEAPNRM